MVIVKRKQPQRATRVVFAGVHLLEFLGRRVGNAHVIAAVVPAEHPAFEAIRAHYMAQAGFEVFDEAPTATVPGVVAVSDAAPAAGPVLDAPPTVVELALRHGWAASDLLGTGQGGDPGPGGGTSPRSGLTLAQMALCSAPEAWYRESNVVVHFRAPGAWPWELAGFKPPGLDFKPPAVAPRRPPLVETAPPAAPPARTEPEASTGDPEATEGDREPQDEGTRADGGLDAPDGEPERRDDSAPPPPAGNPLEGISPAIVDTLRVLVAKLRALQPGKPLHLNKLNYQLGKLQGTPEGAGLPPRVTAAQLAALQLPA